MSTSPERGAGLAARSLLFVPGDRADRFDKAVASGADAVILDLEDAVAPDRKAVARDQVDGWLRAGGRAVVRINAVDTDWYADDLAMLRAHPEAVPMLAKADADGAAATVAGLDGRPIIALLETVAAWFGLRELAAVAGVARIAFGSVDFGVDAGIIDVGEAMSPVRTAIVLASRAAGLSAPIDGVTLEVGDAALIAAHSARSRAMGFGGKLCIHPRQVAAVGGAFRPSAEDLARARRIVAASTASSGGVTVVDGRMVDRPVLRWAEQLLSMAAQRGHDRPD